MKIDWHVACGGEIDMYDFNLVNQNQWLLLKELISDDSEIQIHNILFIISLVYILVESLKAHHFLTFIMITYLL